jgi:hypothetical protein
MLGVDRAVRVGSGRRRIDQHSYRQLTATTLLSVHGPRRILPQRVPQTGDMMTFTEGTPAAQPHGDSTSPHTHNSETNTTAQDGTCGMTHLASGRTCRLPSRHRDSCNFEAPSALLP